MNILGQRIQKLRKEKGYSQTELAKKIGISYAQISRYEIKGSQPPAVVLNKLADVLDTSVDFIINGNSSEKAQNTLKNTEVLNQFKEMEQLPDNERGVLMQVIRAYIRDFKARQTYAI